VTSPPVQVALLATARPPAAADADSAALAATLSRFSETDWSALVEHALAHGSASLLCRHLLAVGAEILPPEVATACSTYLAARESAAADALAQLGFVLDTLAADGIEALPFKGPVLGLQAYGDPAMREYHDLDLLVRREHMSGTLATLRDLGYRSESIIGLRARRIADYYRYNGHDILFAREGLPLEPHWALSPRTFAELDTGPIFDRAVVIETVQGRRFRCFSPEDTLLVAAVHGGKEQWSRLVWVADIAALLHAHPAIDWTTVLARAKQAGCLRMALLAAELASQLLDARLPDHVRAAIARDPAVARLLERVRARLFTDTETPSVFTLTRFRWNARERLGDRLRYASRTLLTARVPHFRAIDLPDRLSFLYPAVRLGHDFLALPVWKALNQRATNRRVRAQKDQQSETIGAKTPIIQTRDAGAHSHDAETWTLQARALLREKRFAEAVEACDNVLKLEPGNAVAARLGVTSRLKSCDWRRRQEDERWVGDCVRTQPQVLAGELGTFIHSFGFGNSEVRSLNCNPLVLAGRPAMREPLWCGESYHHDKIRIVYVSPDFHDPMGYLAAGVFEHHDKERFETTAVSLGSDKRSTLQKRIEAAFDRFVNARNMKDADIAAMLREAEVDIVIDLYSVSRSTQIFSARPAPVLVAYPGYPGTLGVPYIDYIIADHVVIPDDHRPYYSEKVAYLPYSYLPNDNKRRIPEAPPTRGAAGLPETGFVFACFNNPYKITPEIFGIWMRLLHDVEDSVLWLVGDDSSTVLNLRREAHSRGIEATRLVFAKIKPPAQHLARHRLAHLFLDTYPINAGAAAMDALWAGLPVLTCSGDVFAGRIATSLLQALVVPELVTNSLADYEQLARTLAQDPSRLAAVRAKLLRNHDTAPLFDTAHYTRHLESAFKVMWQRSEAKLPPIDFRVDPTLS
jgi:predicted O-linked N-acetylglucosamine transferase (SPINDLY family)